jgi:hypothetical protein
MSSHYQRTTRGDAKKEERIRLAVYKMKQIELESEQKPVAMPNTVRMNTNNRWLLSYFGTATVIKTPGFLVVHGKDHYNPDIQVSEEVMRIPDPEIKRLMTNFAQEHGRVDNLAQENPKLCWNVYYMYKSIQTVEIMYSKYLVKQMLF